MKIIDNLRITRAIPTIAALPLLVALGFGGSSVWSNMERAIQMDELGNLITVSSKMSAAVHEQQKERGLTRIIHEGRETGLLGRAYCWRP